MRNLLYFMTMLFNAIGSFYSLSLFFVMGSNGLHYLPIIISGFVVFSCSFFVTFVGFLCGRRKCRNNYKTFS